MDFQIGERTFGFLKPYVIAEIGVNHEGSIERAKAQIRAVARSGAHAAKFQSYTAAKLASKNNSPAYWDTTKEKTVTQFELFSKLDSFTINDYRQLANVCAEVGLDFMSTPFDLDVVDELEPLVPIFKIASADLTNIPLLRKVAATGKPVIMSTGAATLEEIQNSLSVLEHAGAKNISLLHCVLNYPTPKENANLRAIPTLIENFGKRHPIGYSDHVAPDYDGQMPALDTAVLYGARIIEKHFTDDRTANGNDHYHATDEQGLGRFMAKLQDYEIMMGSGSLVVENQKDAISNARRRIFANREIHEGEHFTEENLLALRANEGIEISNWDVVLGKIANRTILANSAVKVEDIS